MTETRKRIMAPQWWLMPPDFRALLFRFLNSGESIEICRVGQIRWCRLQMARRAWQLERCKTDWCA